MTCIRKAMLAQDNFICFTVILSMGRIIIMSLASQYTQLMAVEEAIADHIVVHQMNKHVKI